MSDQYSDLADITGMDPAKRAKLYAALMLGKSTKDAYASPAYPANDSSLPFGTVGDSGSSMPERMIRQGYDPTRSGYVRGNVSLPIANNVSAQLGGGVAYGNNFSARPVNLDASIINQIDDNSSIEARFAKGLMGARPISAGMYYNRRF